MTSGYVDLSAAGIALGQAQGSVQTRYSALSTPSAGVLQLAGASSGALCRLTGLADPTSPQDAATLASVDAAVLKATRGLQLKQSAQLCSTTAVSLLSAPPPHVRRWKGPWIPSGGGYLDLGNLLTTPDHMCHKVTLYYTHPDPHTNSTPDFQLGWGW